jgi:hypothetical protein
MEKSRGWPGGWAPWRARWGRDAVALAALAAVALITAYRGAPGPVSATLKLGPTTGRHLHGFAPLYEIEGLQATRFTTYDALISLPLAARGGEIEIAYRFARVFGQTAEIEVELAGRTIDRFSCRGGQFAVRRQRVVVGASTPLAIAIKADSHEGRDRGLKLDWVRVSAFGGGRLGLSGAALVWPALLLAMLWCALRFCGLSGRLTLAVTVPWLLLLGVYVRIDPFALAHILLSLGPAAIVFIVGAALAARAVGAGRWLTPIIVTGFLIKGVILFHPATFYPDYQNARKFVQALRQGEGGDLAERTVAAQIATNVGYPRRVAGKDYAFPYSPLFCLPFTWITAAETIEHAYRLAGLVLFSLEPFLVFLLARSLIRRGGDGGAAPDSLAAVPTLAALIAATLPVHLSRLLLAMAVTQAGHVFDVLLLVATLAALRHGGRRWAFVGATALASLLLYVSSLFTVSAFIVMLAIVERRHALRLLALLGGAVAVTVAWLYHPFVRLFVIEILPALLRGGTQTQAAASSPALLALGRIPLFYGWGLPALALAGFVLARRRLERPAVQVLGSHVLAFALLVSLRAFGGGLFKDLKEISFVAPLIAVLAALGVNALRECGRAGRLAAVLVVTGLLLVSGTRSRELVRSYASPFMEVRGADDYFAADSGSGWAQEQPGQRAKR